MKLAHPQPLFPSLKFGRHDDGIEFRRPIMGFSDMERIFYATDLFSFLPTRHNVIFPMALILYDFAAYLTTDSIQPASLTSCAILMLTSVLRRPFGQSLSGGSEWR